jgi:prepilin-type processing-associated H-X9-DG protein
MKPRFSNQRNQALTLTEVLVVVLILAFFAVLVVLTFRVAKLKISSVNCFEKLKMIGLGYRVWAQDHNDKYPMEVSVTNGGAMEFVNNGNVVTVFQIMSNELGTPKVLICPYDSERTCATNFSTDFTSKNISYFVGLDANQTHPQTLLSGDDNFEIGGVPVKPGLLKLSTNTPISWTAARHKFAGNILLADGSVQTVTVQGLQKLLQQTGLATNRLAIP